MRRRGAATPGGQRRRWGPLRCRGFGGGAAGGGRRLGGRVLGWRARPAGFGGAAGAPGVASYTAVLLSQTAVPAWHEAHPYLPFVFTGSAAASGGGLGLLLAPVDEAGPARRMAVAGAGLEVVASRLLEQRLGLAAEAYTTGQAHPLRKWAEELTIRRALRAERGG